MTITEQGHLGFSYHIWILGRPCGQKIPRPFLNTFNFFFNFFHQSSFPSLPYISSFRLHTTLNQFSIKSKFGLEWDKFQQNITIDINSWREVISWTKVGAQKQPSVYWFSNQEFHMNVLLSNINAGMHYIKTKTMPQESNRS